MLQTSLIAKIICYFIVFQHRWAQKIQQSHANCLDLIQGCNPGLWIWRCQIVVYKGLAVAPFVLQLDSQIMKLQHRRNCKLLRAVAVTCQLLVLATGALANGRNVRIKTRDVQTIVKEKSLSSVNADFDDIGFDLDRYFARELTPFSSESVISLTGTAPEKRQAERRAMGGKRYSVRFHSFPIPIVCYLSTSLLQ